MRNFLRETWELWYWANFCPSKLQRRMNEWAPAEEKDGRRADTSYSEILLFRANGRFIAQLFVVGLIFSLPLILAVAASGQPLNWIVIVMTLLSTYGIGVWFLSLALHIPLFFTLVYLSRPEILRYQVINEFIHLIALSRLQLGFGVGMLLLIISLLGWFLLRWHNRILLSRAILAIGSVLSVVVGGSLISQSWQLSLILTGSMGLFILTTSRQIHSFDQLNKFSGPIGQVMIGGFATIVVSIVTGGFAGGITIIVTNHASNISVAVANGIGGFFAGIILVSVVGRIMNKATGRLAIDLGLAVGVAGAIAGGISDDIASGIIVAIAVAIAGIVANMTDRIGGVVASGIACIIGGGIASLFGSGTGIIAFGVAGISLLPLPLLWLTNWLVGLSLAPAHKWWLGITVSVGLAILSIEYQGWLALLSIPATLLGYYRLLPNYPALIFMSLWRTILLRNASPKQLLRWLHSLPPHNDELLWLPLPGHDRILAAAFRADAQVALETLQQMRTSPYPGLPRTARRALPQLVSDQLLSAASLSDLITTATPEHPILPFLVPKFYQPKNMLSDEASPKLATSAPVETEIALMVPQLQTIARDVSAALEGGSVFLRERGLERSLDQLARLQGQLPGMALNVSAIPRWRAVLEHWQAIIQAEIEQQRTASQGEVINPFQSGNPLRDNRAYLFKGRQQFADAIVRQILDRGRPTLVLHGPRRCGKTSFLYNLPRLLSSDMIPVFVDLQKANMTSSEGNFCYGLVRAMRGDMRSQGLAAPAAKRQEFRADPYAALEDWLDEVEPLLESRRILLCLDEFEKLGSAIREGIISLKLLDELRHLIQHRDELSFLFCGVQTLAELGPNWSSYFISIQPIEMTYLEPHEARELLENPDPKFDLRYGEGIVEQVLQVTRCQPYLVQLIGEAIVNQANLHKTRLITRPLLEAALNDALTSGEAYFTNLWDEYTGTTPDEIKVGRALLHNLAHRKPLPTLKARIVRAALQRLIRYHLIEKVDESYRFEVPFVERWVREWGGLE